MSMVSISDFRLSIFDWWRLRPPYRHDRPDEKKRRHLPPIRFAKLGTDYTFWGVRGSAFGLACLRRLRARPFGLVFLEASRLPRYLASQIPGLRSSLCSGSRLPSLTPMSSDDSSGASRYRSAS